MHRLATLQPNLAKMLTSVLLTLFLIADTAQLFRSRQGSQAVFSGSHANGTPKAEMLSELRKRNCVKEVGFFSTGEKKPLTATETDVSRCDSEGEEGEATYTTSSYFQTKNGKGRKRKKSHFFRESKKKKGSGGQQAYSKRYVFQFFIKVE